MSWNKHRNLTAAFCAAILAIGSTATCRAECCLTDWLFGKGHTTYSMPYTAPTVYASNYSVVPAQPACGCATTAHYAPACSTCAPACSTCGATTAYRIAYRPVPTVAYMPVTSVDSCSGCAVTMYQPTRTWTYYGSLQPYTVGYGTSASPACSSCGGCSTCGVAPPSGYSSCYSGCSSCGVPAGGCSACGSSVVSSYPASSGCSSCSVGSGTVYPGPADMSLPAAAPAQAAPPAGTTLGAPALAPTAPVEAPAKTYAPGAGTAPVAPGAPGTNGNPSTDNRSLRAPTATEAGRTVDPPHVQGVPPVINGPSLMTPTPAPRPEGSDRVTSNPVIHASYFQLLAPPPASVPAQTVSTRTKTTSAPAATTQFPAANDLPADDAGWVHVER
jgi:hypothetical protein